MAKGRRPTQPRSTPWVRWGGVLVALVIAGAVVWWVARPSESDTADAGTPATEEQGDGPRPLDLERSSGPTVEAAAELEAPPDSLAAVGPDAPSGIDISNDPRLGSPDAPVTIVEFSDFQCPYCATFHEEMFPALRTLWGDQVRWVFVNRYYTAAHPQAENAAVAAECAAQQGSFWEFADRVFADQQNLSPGMLEDVAEEVGLDMDAFEACYDDRVPMNELRADMAEGDRLGVEGTPSFFVNGKKIVGAQPVDVFNREISQYIR